MEKTAAFFKKIGNFLFGNRKRKIITATTAAAVVLTALIAVGTVLVVKQLTNGAVITSDNNSAVTDTNSSSQQQQGSDGTDIDIPQVDQSENYKPHTENTAYVETEYREMPDISRATMSAAEVVSKYRGYTDWRIYSIRTAVSASVPGQNGRSFYFSNNGKPTNSGKSPQEAISNINALARLGLKAGDVVYFECGSLWRAKSILHGKAYPLHRTAQAKNRNFTVRRKTRQRRRIGIRPTQKIFMFIMNQSQTTSEQSSLTKVSSTP